MPATKQIAPVIPEAGRFLGMLLDATREDLGSKAQLDALFYAWRETSYAPVQAAGVADKWLRGEPTPEAVAP